MDKKLIKGSKLVVLEILHEKLNKLNDETRKVYSVIDEEVQELGREWLGKPQGEGRFMLIQEGTDVYISWEPQEESMREPNE